MFVDGGHTDLFPSPEAVNNVHDYCLDKSTALPENVQQHQRDTLEYCKKSGVDPLMMIGSLQTQFMMFLTQISKAKKVLEIGCFTGFSALAFAHALKDIPGAHVTTLDLPGPNTEFSKETFKKHGVQDMITLVEGPASETLQTLNDKYDLIFIDADKPGYINYVEIILKRDLLAPGGLIAADNALFRGLVADKAGIHPRHGMQPDMTLAEHLNKFNEFVLGHPELENVVMPVFDGLNLIRRK